MRLLGLLVAILTLPGCAAVEQASDAITRGFGATDPTERGLSYVAAAIVTAAVVRGILNK